MPIKHVFVLMLENRSFDNMLGLSGIPGVVNPQGNTNTYNGHTFKVTGPAPASMTTDPGHELPDVVQQLTNMAPGQWKPPLGTYPRQKFPADFANGTGFVTNYVTNTDEENPAPPSSEHYGDVLKCFTHSQASVINQLAGEFAVCTRWHSSIPGPTWPNRFFVHMASSNGMDCSPTQSQIERWALPPGFQSPHGSIFQALNKKGLTYRIYNDCEKWGFESSFASNPAKGGGARGGGWVPQVASLNGIGYNSYYELKYYFESDLANNYKAQYTFIEPHYGNITNNTYQGGSSQHPMDDIYGGEKMIKFVYETLRKSPVWNESLLIITYDEHGGFYDSVAPPPGNPPADGSPGYGVPGSLNTFGFQFDQLGVRVPAVLVSPLIRKGVVDSTLYDHTSVLATLESLFGLSPLTHRDKTANNLLKNVILETPREDCIETLQLPEAPESSPGPLLSPEQQALHDALPLPESGNLIGSMGILLKMHHEISGGNFLSRFFIRLRFRRIKTFGDLRDYARHVGQLRFKKLGGPPPASKNR